MKDDLDYFPGLFYFGENNVYIYMKNYDEIPDYVGKVLIPKSRDVDRLPYYPQKAFVLEPDYSYKIEALY